MAEITHTGQNTTSTLGGEVRIEEGRGRMVIYDPLTQRELNVVDRTGYLFSDADDRRIKIGSKADGTVGIYVSPVGEDVIDIIDG